MNAACSILRAGGEGLEADVEATRSYRPCDIFIEQAKVPSMVGTSASMLPLDRKNLLVISNRCASAENVVCGQRETNPKRRGPGGFAQLAP